MTPPPDTAVRPSSSAGAVLEGRCVAAGATSCALFDQLLGLADAGPHIHAVAWLDHAVEAAMPLADDQQVVFRLERSSDDSQGMVKTEHLVLYFRGPQPPEPLILHVQQSAARELQRWTLERIAAQLAQDPELGKPGLPMPPGVDAAKQSRSLLDTWGGQDAYADFFAGGELARSQLDSLDPSNLFSFVQHSDAECLHVNPHCAAPIIWLVNYPWDDRRRGSRPAAAGEASATLESLSLDEMMTTDLDENDVIMGNPEKLQRVIDHAVCQCRKHGKTVFFSNTCVPVVTGEDVESRVDHARLVSGCPLLYLTVTPRSMVNVFHDLLVDRRLAAEQQAGAPRPACINLIGFGRSRALDELQALLAALGIAVNTFLLPDLSHQRIEQLPQASYNVFLPNQLWQHLYDQVQFNSRTPWIAPHAPYGFGATQRWLQEIVRALDLPVDVAARWPALAAPYEAERQRLCALAREQKYRLALVIRGDETYYLTRPANAWGVPLVALLEELGFGLDILLKVADKAAARKAAHEVYELFGDARRHTIKGFNSYEGMLERLQQSPAQAVFSSHFFDWRITQSGKNLFSLQLFELGPTGALRTAERLLNVCKTPFYRRYSRFLARTVSGLRAATPGV